MEHFLEGFGKLSQKRRFVFVTLLTWVNVPMSLWSNSFKEMFHYNAPAKRKNPLFNLSWRKSAIKDVNDLAPNLPYHDVFFWFSSYISWKRRILWGLWFINEKNSIYVLTEICHQRCKWLGPKSPISRRFLLIFFIYFVKKKDLMGALIHKRWCQAWNH